MRSVLQPTSHSSEPCPRIGFYNYLSRNDETSSNVLKTLIQPAVGCSSLTIASPSPQQQHQPSWVDVTTSPSTEPKEVFDNVSLSTEYSLLMPKVLKLKKTQTEVISNLQKVLIKIDRAPPNDLAGLRDTMTLQEENVCLLQTAI